MASKGQCTLCSGETGFFYEEKHKKYYKCCNCSSILLDAEAYLSKELEQKEYEEHNNNVNDIRYQEFVAPITTVIQNKFNKEHAGLDFGAGTGPVITKILRDSGFNIELYDPFFWNNPALLNKKYDYIACCEVIEHFRNPFKEFGLLRSLLKPNGSLYCMTKIYTENIEFQKWHYKNDPTHVFFYHEKAIAWIGSHFNFSTVSTQDRLIHFAA
ncbi:MAG: class I SAM-dependent methyltransferase [Clostridiales bacterium]|nr:class I SAM-dependent methyltransferase [Clostridiales bacterium]